MATNEQLDERITRLEQTTPWNCTETVDAFWKKLSGVFMSLSLGSLAYRIDQVEKECNERLDKFEHREAEWRRKIEARMSQLEARMNNASKQFSELKAKVDKD